jgi:hypothetical protein
MISIDFVVEPQVRLVLELEPGDAMDDLPVKLGQRGRFFTFRIKDVPANVETESVGKRIVKGFAERGCRPENIWPVAYYLDWPRLRDHGVEAEEPGVVQEKVAEMLGRPVSSIVKAVGKGHIPVTRPKRPGGGQAPSLVNPADIQVFQKEYPPLPMGRPPLRR